MIFRCKSINTQILLVYFNFSRVKISLQTPYSLENETRHEGNKKIRKYFPKSGEQTAKACVGEILMDGSVPLKPRPPSPSSSSSSLPSPPTHPLPPACQRPSPRTPSPPPVPGLSYEPPSAPDRRGPPLSSWHFRRGWLCSSRGCW